MSEIPKLGIFPSTTYIAGVFIPIYKYLGNLHHYYTYEYA